MFVLTKKIFNRLGRRIKMSKKFDCLNCKHGNKEITREPCYSCDMDKPSHWESKAIKPKAKGDTK